MGVAHPGPGENDPPGVLAGRFEVLGGEAGDQPDQGASFPEPELALPGDRPEGVDDPPSG